MGQFSWLCASCDEQILSEGQDWECFKCEQEYKGKEPVILVTPNGNQLREGDYEGYGVFAGIDAYSWLARVNGYSDLAYDDEDDSDRGIGIDIYFDKTIKLEYPIKIVHERCLSSYQRLEESKDDPNQGWQQNLVEEGSLTVCDECSNW